MSPIMGLISARSCGTGHVVARVLLGVLLWLGLVSISSSQDAATAITPEAQTRAKQLVKELYGDEIAKAKLPASREALAKKLRAAAIEYKDDAASREALFQEAVSLAVDAGAIKVAAQFASEQAGEDDERACLAVLTLLQSASAKPSAPSTQVADAAANAISRGVRAERFDLVEKLADLIVTSASKAREPSWLKRAPKFKEAAKELASLKKEFDAATARIETDPQDFKAAATIGKFECFIRDEWESGLSKLARGDDAIHKAAAREINGDDTPASLVSVADMWMEAAPSQPDVFRAVVLKHADERYQVADAKVVGLEKSRVAKRRDEIAKLLKQIDSPLMAKTTGDAPKALAASKSPTGKTVEPAVVRPGKQTLGISHIQPGIYVIDSARYETTRGVFDVTDRLNKAAKIGACWVTVDPQTLAPDKGVDKGSLKVRGTFAGARVEQTVPDGGVLGYGPTIRPLPGDKLQIIYAFYGAGVLGEPTFLDVTEHLSGFIKNNSIRMLATDILEGLDDPAPNMSKWLFVGYCQDGKNQSALVRVSDGVLQIGKPTNDVPAKPENPTPMKKPLASGTKPKLAPGARVDISKIPVKTTPPFSTSGRSPSVIEVLEATLGADNNKIDLTDRFKLSVMKTGYVVVSPMVTGFVSDPRIGGTNQPPLMLRYKVDGLLHVEIVRPHMTVIVDGRKTAMKPSDSLKVHEAYFGGGFLGESSWVDVTERAAASVVDGKISETVSEITSGLDPKHGPCRLVIHYSHKGESRWVSYASTESVRIGTPQDLPSVKPLPPPTTPPIDGFELVDATYWRDERTSLSVITMPQNVTERFRSAAATGRIMAAMSPVLGPDIASSGSDRTLSLRYRINGRLIEQNYLEGSVINIETRPLPPPNGATGLEIMDAYAGAGVVGEPTWTDVTAHVANLVQGRTYTNTSSEMLKTLPLIQPKVFPKFLVVRYRLDGEVRVAANTPQYGSLFIGK